MNSQCDCSTLANKARGGRCFGWGAGMGTCSKDPTGCAGPQVTFLQEPGWMGHRHPWGLTSLPARMQLPLPPARLGKPLLSCCKNLVDSGCRKITRSKCPRSSSGGQGQAHTEDRQRVLEPASANTCHTAGAVCGKAIPSWRRTYKYKILTNNRNFNSRLSGKEPNITLPNKPPVFFLKVNFMRVVRSTAMRMLLGIRLFI